MSATAPGVVVLALLAFVALGLPDAALGVAWPGIRDAFARSQSALGLILAASSVGFFAASNAAAALFDRLGPGAFLGLATLLLAASLIGQATAASFGLVLAAAALWGLGAGAIDAGLNGYAARRFSRRDMNWLHAGYGLGTAVAPFVMTAGLAVGAGWRGGYGAIAVVLAALATLFWRRRHLWPPVASGIGRAPRAAGGLDLAAARHLTAFFLYTGVEATAGQWAFAVLSEARGLGPEAAGLWTGLYWTSLFGGRLAIGLVADRLGTARLVAGGVAGIVAGAIVFAGAPGAGGASGLVVMGSAAAPVFPMLMTRTAERFPVAVARRLFGLQVSAAMLGAVFLPWTAGALADAAGLASIPIFLAAAAATLALVVAFILRDRRPQAT
jgi:fucose permease